MVVDWIKRTFDALPQPRRWSDIAVLYRKHRHRDLIVERLRKQDIPYVVVGGTGLFSVAEVRDVEAALRVAANPEDSAAFVRLLSAGPWRLDAAEILRLTNAAAWDGRPVYNAALDILRDGEISVSEPPGAALPDDGAKVLAAAQTLWADSDFDESEPDTVKQRRNREQRAQWRREQLDARLRVKLERLIEHDQPARAARPARRPVRRARGVPRAHQHAARPDRRRDAGRAANRAGARPADAFRGGLAVVSSARQPRPVRRLSRRVPAGRWRPGHRADRSRRRRGRPADDRLPGQGPRVRGGRRAAAGRGPVPRHARRADAASRWSCSSRSRRRTSR